jgi:phage shock protein A
VSIALEVKVKQLQELVASLERRIAELEAKVNLMPTDKPAKGFTWTNRNSRPS